MAAAAKDKHTQAPRRRLRIGWQRWGYSDRLPAIDDQQGTSFAEACTSRANIPFTNPASTPLTIHCRKLSSSGAQ